MSETARDALSSFVTSTASVPPNELDRVLELTARALGASSARVLIADYALVSLQELGVDGPTGAHHRLHEDAEPLLDGLDVRPRRFRRRPHCSPLSV